MVRLWHVQSHSGKISAKQPLGRRGGNRPAVTYWEEGYREEIEDITKAHSIDQQLWTHTYAHTNITQRKQNAFSKFRWTEQ